ncbi:class I SAM-dependent methyltransferase [Flavobacterium agricola]|uniref:Class I SAM-dependent methyltransferase n=1 Tax=Flavobacterium agricola TaxID=2870839 RepID=A0ABY6M236_9FLAO|nr:class I SAM-dependent methyltransferase [Flavobacterium agricola]UYW01704.1 class I SAM-dependent methyltransferase [Flavobacterium agricola]
MKALIQGYFKFLKRSTNQHGVHSPFVFKLVTQCFYDKQNKSAYKVLQAYRNRLLQNKNTIHVTDFGAGSRIFKTNQREIAKIAKTAGITKARAELLYRVTAYFKPKQVLEIGTSLGLATAALAAGNSDAEIISLEGCPETAATALENLQHFNLHNATVKIGEFTQSFKELETKKFDLIYFDGNHQKDATLAYFDALLPTAHNDSVWIFDDIHWSKPMNEAWEIIKNKPEVCVTIDTFQWGFVFFRTEQEKEHFTIRT